MRVVVTGSAGRVGAVIVRRLEGEAEVLGLDLHEAPTVHRIADVRDASALRASFRGADAVVHVAALHAPHVGRRSDEEFRSINVEGTRSVLEAMRACEVPRLLLTSTTALYGTAQDFGPAAWIDEATPPRPRTIYHRSKLAAEALVEDAAVRGAVTARILRMSRCFPEPAPWMALYRLHRGVDARDVADAHARALVDRGPALACYVISGATPFHRSDAPALGDDAPGVLARRAPRLIEAFVRRGWPLPARIDRVYDAGLAQRALGWQSRHGFESVLEQLDAGDPEVLVPSATRGGEE